MIIATFILSLINLIGISIAGAIYFKEKYLITTIEQWNEIAHVYNAVVNAGLVNEEGELQLPISQENVGFFRDEIEEDLFDDDEEENKKASSKKSKK